MFCHLLFGRFHFSLTKKKSATEEKISAKSTDVSNKQFQLFATDLLPIFKQRQKTFLCILELQLAFVQMKPGKAPVTCGTC